MHKLRCCHLLACIVLAWLGLTAARAEAQIALLPLDQSIKSRGQADAGRSSSLGTVPPGFEKLKLAPGFLISIYVMDDSDFNGSYRVDQQGKITVPFLGDLQVANETVTEAREQIRQKLIDEKFLIDPQVQVAIAEYAAPEVTIVGEVASPGKYPLLIPRKLVDVLSLAGGPTTMAGDQISILGSAPGSQPVVVHYSRGTNSKDVENVLVHPGDTVQVKRAGVVYILGAVNRPGAFVMQEEGTLTLLEAVSMAAGTSPLVASKHVYLLRHNQDGTVVRISLPYSKIAKGKSADLALRNLDILYFPDSRLKTAFSNTQELLTATATASVYRFY